MCLGSARRDPASSGLAATRSRSACHFGGGPGFPETRGAAVSCVCLGAMPDVRTACVLFASSLPRGIVNHFFSEREGRALSFLTRHGDAGDDARVARRQSRERNAEMVRRRASKWRARVRRGDALFSGTPRSLFPVVVRTHRPFRIRALFERRFWIHAVSIHAVSRVFFTRRAVWKFREKSRPITSESKSGKLSLPIRSRPSWPIKGPETRRYR